MPNRILKESICTSEQLSELTWFEEVLFYRLIVSCDDFGRFDGRVAVIKNHLFPLKENLTMKNVQNAIDKLARAGLISLYEVDGRPFLFLPTWAKHQSQRATKSKYPQPPEINCKQLQANDFNCLQMFQYSYSYSYSNAYSISESENAPAREENGKKPFGEYANVMLTEAERAELVKRYGKTAERLIDVFSRKLKAKGYKYDDHFAAIVLWAEEDGAANGSSTGKDADEWFEERLRLKFGEEG